mmetsp:Transcript_90125/g.276008  ORF Transcript_90125/g.276008 Transcript_90125/m.276008 type:complete len:211 (+) Transcript_90125:414-1046(+)
MGSLGRDVVVYLVIHWSAVLLRQWRRRSVRRFIRKRLHLLGPADRGGVEVDAVAGTGARRRLAGKDPRERAVVEMRAHPRGHLRGVRFGSHLVGVAAVRLRAVAHLLQHDLRRGRDSRRALVVAVMAVCEAVRNRLQIVRLLHLLNLLERAGGKVVGRPGQHAHERAFLGGPGPRVERVPPRGGGNRDQVLNRRWAELGRGVTLLQQQLA